MWWILFKDWCCHFPIIWTIFSRLINLSFPRVLPQMLSALWLGISVSSDHDLKPAVKCQKKVERRWVEDWPGPSACCLYWTEPARNVWKENFRGHNAAVGYLVRNLGMTLSHHTAFLDLTYQLFHHYCYVKHSQGNKKPLMVPLVSGFLINSKMQFIVIGNVC